MPMEEFPTLDELYWLFESEPVFADPDLGWPVSEATWSTARGDWTVTVRVGVYDRTVEVSGELAGVPAIHVKLDGVVEHLAVDRTHNVESLSIAPGPTGTFHPVRLTLKPSIFVDVENRHPWERA